MSAQNDLDASTGKAPIEIGRPLMTSLPILGIARHLGIPVADPEGLHVTLVRSLHLVDWSSEVVQLRTYPIIVEPQLLQVAQFGDFAALIFESAALQARHQALAAAGARSDLPEYTPRIMLGPWQGEFPMQAIPLESPLVLGPEYHKPAKI